VWHGNHPDGLGVESELCVPSHTEKLFGDVPVRDCRATPQVVDAGRLPRLPGLDQDAGHVVGVHVISTDVAVEEFDATAISKELEEARRDARVMRLVLLTRAEHIEEPKAHHLTLKTI